MRQCGKAETEENGYLLWHQVELLPTIPAMETAMTANERNRERNLDREVGRKSEEKRETEREKKQKEKQRDRV